MSEELIATGIVASGLPAGLGQIVDVGLPGFTMAELDISHQASASYRGSLPGKLATPGELVLTSKFSGNYPAPQTSGNNPMSIWIPDGALFIGVTFSGYVKGFAPAKASLDGIMMTDITVKVNGAITIV